MKNLVYILSVFILFSSMKQQENRIQVKGELKQWHKITLVVPGPETSEWARENPFLDYKLDVTFSNGNKTYVVPGFFAADGNAAETSADEGNTWEVRFRPDKTGTWNYKISFRKGEDIVVKDGENLGEATKWDGLEGSFDVTKSDKRVKISAQKGG